MKTTVATFLLLAMFAGCDESQQPVPSAQQQGDRSRSPEGPQVLPDGEASPNAVQPQPSSETPAGIPVADAESPESQADARGVRAELVQELVAKGDELVSKNKIGAYYAYHFAAIYAPADPAIVERPPRKGVDFSSGFMPPEEIREGDILRVMKAADAVPVKFMIDWPESDAKTEITELRILLEPKLVGDLYCMPLEKGEGKALVFYAEPEMTLSGAKAKFGEPVSEATADDCICLNYGRVRLVADTSGKVNFVLYRPTQKGSNGEGSPTQQAASGKKPPQADAGTANGKLPAKSPSYPVREWTATSGHKTRASLVRFDGTKVWLKKEDNRVVEVLRDKLVEADRAYLRSLTAPTENSKARVRQETFAAGFDYFVWRPGEETIDILDAGGVGMASFSVEYEVNPDVEPYPFLIRTEIEAREEGGERHPVFQSDMKNDKADIRKGTMNVLFGTTQRVRGEGMAKVFVIPKPKDEKRQAEAAPVSNTLTIPVKSD